MALSRKKSGFSGGSFCVFQDIARLHSFAGFGAKGGRRLTAVDVATIEDAVMVVDGSGRVEWVGTKTTYTMWLAKRKKRTRSFKPKLVSLNGAEVLPAFIECHTHLLYSGSRADEFERRNRGDHYLEIAMAGGGIQSTVKATALAKTSELVQGLKSRIDALVRQGVSTIEIKTGYAGTIKEELRHLKLLIALREEFEQRVGSPTLILTCLAAHSLPPTETESTWLAAIKKELFPLLRKQDIRLDIFVEKGAFSREGARDLLVAAKAANIVFAVHADQLSLSGGTALGVELGAQSVDHVIEVGPKEIENLAASKTVATLLPAADLYTRLPYPKARAMIDAGARVAIASDHNPGSSPGLDLALVGLLARAGMQMTLPEVLAAYSVNAAAALGLNDRGTLTTGARADFLVLKKGSGLSDLFYAVGPEISHAAIAGVWLKGRPAKPLLSSKRA